MKNKLLPEWTKNIFKNMGKDKLLIIILAGILLLIISIPTKTPKTSPPASTSGNSSNADSSAESKAYEQYLEQKISNLLSKVDKVGKVNVMVSLKGSSQKKLASQDSYSENSVKETDSSGGVRESMEKSTQQAYLSADTANGSEPYVTQEIKPEVEGVLVIAQGASDAAVVSNITNAIAALLNVPIHKIQVLKMSD